jgi:SAM-dependent methyltransferase
MRAGEHHHRAWVGPPQTYDLVAAGQFGLLTQLGLREHHTLLDVGCGSLRGGRLFIPYLLPERYFGIEPETWALEEGIASEVGRDLIDLKRPSFSDVDDFRLSVFGRRFDYILAQSIFSHAARHQIERCLAEAAEVLEPEGLLAATWMEGPDHAGTEWVYPECATYQADSMGALVEAAGLRFEPVEWPHPNGQRWFVATRPDAPPRAEGGTIAGTYGLRERLATAEGALERIGRHPVYRAYRWVRRLGRPR